MYWIPPEYADIPDDIMAPADSTAENHFIIELCNSDILLIAQLLHIYKVIGPAWMIDTTDKLIKELSNQTSIVSTNPANHNVSRLSTVFAASRKIYKIEGNVWHSPIHREPVDE